MFEKQRALFVYAVTPVHMGAGTAIGIIDNPIQRERHTNHPMLAGSGLKGAVRHHFQASGWDNSELTRLFGPDSQQASDHAGAVSFTDAQLAAFPVRSLKKGFVYATSATALGRAHRALSLAKAPSLGSWGSLGADDKKAKVAAKDVLSDGGKLVIEAFALDGQVDTVVGKVGAWLAEHALPQGDGYGFFRDKLKTDLVVLPDEDFGYFVEHATVVEPHVRIDDTSGTAEEGGLFYSENLPPESLLLSVVMTSLERRKKGNAGDGKLGAEEIMNRLIRGPDDDKPGLDGQVMQIGGDSTSGRGLVVVTAVGG